MGAVVEPVNELHDDKRDADTDQHRPSILQLRDCEHRSYLHDYIISPCVLRPALEMARLRRRKMTSGLRRAFGGRSVTTEVRGQS
jgi:hypothetical protein